MKTTATTTQSARPSRRRGRPSGESKAMQRVAAFFDTVPMMRLAARYGTKGMAVAAVVMCAVAAADGRAMEWTERAKWLTLRSLPDVQAQEMDEIVTAMAAMGVVDEQMYTRHGILAYAAEREPACTEKAELFTEKAELFTKKAELFTEKAELFTEKAELRTENTELCAENAELTAHKETETKQEKQNENAPAPPKGREKEINKEKETAAEVPSAVSSRPAAEADAARGTGEKQCRENGAVPCKPMAKTAQGTGHKADGVDYAVVRTSWNSMMQGRGIPLLRSEISGQRRRMFGARVREYGKAVVWAVMRKVATSSYLCGGGSRGFTATFDWMLRPQNFQKILDGHYDNDRTMRMRRSVVLGQQQRLYC